KLNWSGPGATTGLVPGARLSTDYDLLTGSTDPDGKVAAIRYNDNGMDPAARKATASVADPTGAALATVTSFELPGAGFLRPLTRTLPAGNQTTNTYYGATETADPCAAFATDPNQAGRPSRTTDPTP